MKCLKINIKDLPNTKTPILSYCRELLKQGFKPRRKLEVYRNHDYPDVIVRHIGKAAKLTVSEAGTPIFKKCSAPSDFK